MVTLLMGIGPYQRSLHMTENFLVRLKQYYVDVAKVLKGHADAASVFPNSTDVGLSRERVYFEFLKQHAPSKCNVFLGGFLFDEDGAVSSQLDIIITTDTAPRFNFHNQDGTGKSFSPVEGSIGVVSVKSTLDRKELYDALRGLASIPPTRALDGRVNPQFQLSDYDNWPVKVVYASAGISPVTLLRHLNAFYSENPGIPFCRRPDFIHVAGSCFIVRGTGNSSTVDQATGDVTEHIIGEYYPITEEPDIHAILWILDKLQGYVTASTHILFKYHEIANRVVQL